MLGRRQVLLSSASILAAEGVRPAWAIVPIILAALAAITALALATGKAAEALERVVDGGQRLWTVIASVPEKEAARRDIQKKQEHLRSEIGIRQEVIAGAGQSQTANSAFVTSVRLYLITRDSSAWSSVMPAMDRAASALGVMANVFRTNAFWFPAAAQDSLEQLPRLYEARVSIISDLKRLSQGEPPKGDEELNAWSRLVDGYDHLRVQSLKLIKALDTYVS